jgi:biopolymer transport protein ExbB
MWAIIQAAGWPIWPLILMSVIVVALIIERFIALRESAVCPPGLTEKVIAEYKRAGATPQLIDLAAGQGPLGIVLASGLANARGSRASVKEALEEAGNVVGHRLERFLNMIGTIATAAPLVGLLGTVIGMIEIFASNNAAGVNPTQLASGISIALYNTAMGIIVAVPALIAYRYFRGKIDGLLVDMETQALRLAHVMHPDKSK